MDQFFVCTYLMYNFNIAVCLKASLYVYDYVIHVSFFFIKGCMFLYQLWMFSLYWCEWLKLLQHKWFCWIFWFSSFLYVVIVWYLWVGKILWYMYLYIRYYRENLVSARQDPRDLPCYGNQYLWTCIYTRNKKTNIVQASIDSYKISSHQCWFFIK